MIYRFIASLSLSCLLFVSPVLAEAPKITKPIPVQKVATGSKLPQVKRSTPSPIVASLIQEKALKYNLDPKDLYDTISCESNFITDVQSRHVLNGVREKSYGLSQINLPWNPQVTYDQAIDPEFAVEFMAYHFSIGQHSKWSCWKIVRPNGS